MTKNILSFLIPTDKPDELADKFYTCLPVFEPIKEYITFCFNFQPPYTEEIIKKVVDELTSKGFKVAYCFNDYKWTPKTFSFVRMRNDAAQVAPKDTLYFVDYDDDILYYEDAVETASKLWLSMLIYILQRPRFGSIRLDACHLSDFGLDLLEDRIYPCNSMWVRTGLGLIYKNIYNGNVLPDHCLALRGSREDNLEIYQRILDGYLTAFLLNSSIGEHTDFKPELSMHKYGLKQYEQEEDTCTHYKYSHWTDIMAAYPTPPDDFETDPEMGSFVDIDMSASIIDLKVQLDMIIDEAE